jgi:diguanylate cyclase (GGDEF)-like protein/PAS domain S-box-containing protein
MNRDIRILMVEDVAAEAEVTSRQLEQAGLQCTTHRVDSEDALREALRDFAPDVIVSDFALPGFDGFAALSVARAIAPEIPFIFFSGTIGEERAIQALQRGAVDYVLKGNEGRLPTAIVRALDEAAARSTRRLMERRLRDIVDTTQDWIWELNAARRFVFSSESVRGILGYSPDELQGSHALQYVHEEDRPIVQAALDSLGPGKLALTGIASRWRHRDGSYRWLERNALVLLDSDNAIRGFRGTDRDFTHRRQHEMQIARLTRVLRLLSGVSSAVVRIRDRMELMREACRLAVDAGGYAAAFVSLLKSSKPVAKPVAWAGGLERAQIEAERFAVANSPDGDDSVTGQAVRSGTVVVCNDLRELGANFRTRHTMLTQGFRCVAALPLVVDDITIGALTLTARETDMFGSEELEMLREVAANLSFGLQYSRKENAVRYLSHFDALTGLAKRKAFCKRLPGALEQWGERGSDPAVVVFDIEGLSVINDSFGRQVGDKLLQSVAQRLKEHVPDDERLAHLGGGTFAAVLDMPGADDELQSPLQPHVTAMFAQPFVIDGRELPVSARWGIARYPENGLEPGALLQNAEAAVHRAKASGEKYLRHRVEINSEVAARLAMEHKLRTALDTGQFELHYQPKVSVASRRIEGVEALIRWRDPEKGLVSPAAFLPILESTGLIVGVGDWVLRQAAADSARWRAAGLPAVRIAVNLSPLQLRRRSFAAEFLRIASVAASSSGALDVEITEGALLEDAAEILRLLETLREQGVRIAIDDFGTGYSSLSRLSTLPIDTLKIDRSFVKDLPEGRSAATLASTIVSLGKAFGMTIVAEGVETAQQLEHLAHLGCDQSQGFLHSRPVPQEQFAELLARGNGPLILPAEPAPPVAVSRRA